MHPGDRRHATSWAAAEEGARYERGRPGYPDAAGPALAGHLRLGPGRRVADVAAGTGKLTRVLLTTGATVVAVEPMPGMRRQLAALGPDAHPLAGTAEALPLRRASLHAVTVAQAFHWFALPEAAWELHRVLRPDGRLAIVTNTRDPAWGRMEQIGRVLARYEDLGPRPQSVRQWRRALADTGAFRSVGRLELGHEQRFDTLEDFDARFSSISFAILLEPAARVAMLRELREVVAGVDPLVVPLRTVIEVLEPTGANGGVASGLGQ